MANWIIYSHANKCRPQFPYNIYTPNRNTFPLVIYLIVVHDVDFLLVSVGHFWSSYIIPNVNRTLNDSQLNYFHHWRCCLTSSFFGRERERASMIFWHSKKDISWHHRRKVVSFTMPFHRRHSLQEPNKASN
jgi:hypothetical protein